MLRWGVLGAGGIAGSFVRDLALLEGHEVVAVGSRAQQSADAFGDRFGIPRRHPSYDALVADEGVDVVYVATPHSGHRDAALLAIEAGKHVLVEKPFVLNSRQGEEVVAAARSAGVFCMEAMWTRFLPHVVRIREVLAAGTLGDIVSVMIDFAVRIDVPSPGHRLLNPALGGGALLDLGVYPLYFASMVLGPPTTVHATATLTDTGVDRTTSMLLAHEGGAHSLLMTTMAAEGPQRAVIVGTEACLKVDRSFFTPSTFTVLARDGSVLERYDTPHEGGGLRHQAAEVGRCIAAGQTESPTMSLDETLALTRVLDGIRAQIGVVYPGDV